MRTEGCVPTINTSESLTWGRFCNLPTPTPQKLCQETFSAVMMTPGVRGGVCYWQLVSRFKDATVLLNILQRTGQPHSRQRERSKCQLHHTKVRALLHTVSWVSTMHVHRPTGPFMSGSRIQDSLEFKCALLTLFPVFFTFARDKTLPSNPDVSLQCRITLQTG